MIMSDPERFVSAAVRFQKNVGQAAVRSQKNVGQEADYVPPERTRYLARKLARTKANMLAAAAVAAGAPANAEHTVAQISQERIIGSSDLVDINYLELAIAVGRGVARIQIGNEYGTGFLIGPGLAMTNHHVIEDETDGRNAVFQFDYQDNSGGELLARQDFRADVSGFFLTDEELDFTLVALAPASQRGRPVSAYPWTKLIGETGKAEKGDPLNIIQHPRGGLKQIAFRENKVIEIPDARKDFLYYTTDTEPGSSGSPCFNDQWELVALHHSGVPELNAEKKMLRKDGQIWREGIDPEGLINWIGNEGARVSAIVAALRAVTLKPEWRDLRDQTLEADSPNPIELARSTASNGNGTPGKPVRPVAPIAVSNNGGNMGQSFSWNIPLQVTVTLGNVGAQAATVSTASEAALAVAETDGAMEVTIDHDWSKREGYKTNFLDVEVPLPKLSTEQIDDTVDVPPQYRKDGDKHRLNYYHYTVVMNKKRRTAWFSACMIDGTRFINFKRGTDKWFLDPRIDSKFQMGEELYAAARTDRGHLTRFKDLSWGANKNEALKATNDSFHFTNCTLQLDGFNEGKERWQGLEQFLLEQHAKKDERKMVVFTGPVLLDSDPSYRNKFMNYSTRIPLAFWKVCCLRRDDGSLAATGFKLSQDDITALPGFEEKFDVGVAQVTIAELQDLTGLNFGILAGKDHFAKGGDPGTLEVMRPEGGKRKIKPIVSYEDIVV